MISCRRILDGLCDYLDGTSDPDSIAATERHLEDCPSCRLIYATTRETLRIYKSAWSECCLPAEVEARLMAAVDRRCHRNPEGNQRVRLAH